MSFHTGRPTTSVAIIGAGDVGAAAAYALILQQVASELVLVDVRAAFLDAQVRDLSDAAFRGAPAVRAGSLADAGRCDVIVVTAGAKQHPGESRLGLLGRNLHILATIIAGLRPTLHHDAILLLVANPVDILTQFAQDISGLPRHQVIGSGTFLDSTRLRGLLAHEAKTSASSIHAYVLGEHGDSQFVAWSIATIGGVPLALALPAGSYDPAALAAQCCHQAATIIAGKGATSFGIGAMVASICSCILLDEASVRPVSHWVPDLGCCISLPVALGRRGAVRTFRPLLVPAEQAALDRSAATLTAAVRDAAAEFAAARAAFDASVQQVAAAPADAPATEDVDKVPA